MKFLIFIFSISSSVVLAQVPPHTILDPAKISFDYMSSDGGFWLDCTHTKGTQPHSWTVQCQDYRFSLHLLLREFIRADETTYEFHYWATEGKVLGQTRTQSTWLTVDTKSQAKKVVSYLGFMEDATQLRLEINLNHSHQVRGTIKR